LQGAGPRDDPESAAAVPAAEHGRLAPLYRADGLPAGHPLAGTVAQGSSAGAFGCVLRPHDPVRSPPVDLSGRLLVVQSVCVAAAFRVWRLVRAGGRATIVADTPPTAGLLGGRPLSVRGLFLGFLGGRRLSWRGLFRDLDVVFPAAGRPDPCVAVAPYLSDQQDRFRRLEVCPFPRIGRRCAALRA